jgi:2-polyprenyl-3-methyl-5-hydroxy-6-metoxy-1,4-benzoquinol methylase
VKLQVIKEPGRGEQESPEWRFALQTILAGAREVYSRVEFSWSHEPWNPADHVLLLGPHCYHLSPASLSAMKSALTSGVALATPVELQQSGLNLGPLHGPSGFEPLEREFLKSPESRPASAEESPITLYSWQSFQEALTSNELQRLLQGPISKGASCGLYFQFQDYYGHLRADIEPHLPSRIKDVLEIGCGAGETARWLRDKTGCRVSAIELNPAVAKAAEEYLDEVFVGDVQSIEVPKQFDLVLALEVFEHLTRQEDFLAKTMNWLRPGGRLLMSVPNVGHYSVVKDLLEGRWDYIPQGLLCYTHFRFFTRRTIEQWLEMCGLYHYKLVAQKTELPADLAPLGNWKLDKESLTTSGFYVLVDKPH